VTDRTAQTRPPTADAGATGEFERLYRANVEAVTAYFARRSADPQVVQASGIQQANAELHQLGTDVVVVPVQPGCPPLRPPAVSPKGKLVGFAIGRSRDGFITVSGRAPAGDIIVVGVEATPHGWGGVSRVSSLPAPACISPPALPGSGSNG
jgi:hypothetical protein